MKYLPVLSALLLSPVLATDALAQATNQGVQVVRGVVTKVESAEITTDDKSAEGAVVGGAIGYAHGQDAGGTLGGAAVGAIVGSSKTKPGLRYTVATVDGSNVDVVVADTISIEVGSCVSAEVSAGRSTIRAVDQAVCDLEMQTAVPRSQPQAVKETGNCQAAQQQLLDATTAEEVELANSKIQILCN